MAAKVNSMPDVAVRPLGSGPPPYNSFGGPPPHHVTDHDRGSSYMLEGAVGVSLMHHEPPPKPDGFYKTWIFGKVLDPRSKTIIAWNRVFLLSRFWALAIEPLFLYTVAISPHRYCFYIDGWFGIFVTLFRCVSDLMHLWHIWLQLKLAYVARKSLVLGSGKLVWDARMVALHYLRPSGGFVFDLFVVFPILQIVIWGVVPEMIRRGGKMSGMMTSILVAFAIQFVYKVFHLITLVPRMQRVTGYVFGTAWWGFALNLTAYFVAAHAAGACWYLLALQRISSCLYDQCKMKAGCNARDLGSSHAILYGPRFSDPSPLTSAKLYADVAPTCLENKGDVFKYGIFITALPLTTSRNFLNRILYPIFWGLMTLSSFGNAMVPSNQMLEVIFSILVITCGLMLFTLLIGNIQVFLHSMTAKKEEMRLKIRDLEVWMKRRQLPSRLRHRVRQYERQKWAALRGVDEHAMVRELPEGVRRDVKRHLCLDLVRQVPLFYQMDEIVLDTICDRVKPLMFIKGETISRTGDPVQRMLFIVRGRLQSIHNLSENKTSIFTMEPGSFCGDELLSWCLRRPFVDRLPPSIATLRCLDSVEAFGFEARDLKYVTDHFRTEFANEKLKRTARYYSSGWRTWAAVTIQLAWRRFKAARVSVAEPARTSRDRGGAGLERRLSIAASDSDKLRMYTAMFLSPKPQDHL
ncbi:cyclic nucleotide-gated ion channel 2 isoform X2 [Selaginella moellendorffii]|uniref:cyclic nucleotide-gated ion channel 2 isoform X2 n=1 Tax=Selaginella moellendorffii TaxID=88036 RepID=UPI000D1C4CB7|nr:cyclic nucleotide-gated ion channel 2 isoform X2 [Selaginella moellendorffii]|eukprot:XP_024537642.1 cyclic nucleotide-gated ion channel 2 isoform X2 [Selaginella moellendorffii]